MSLTELHVAEEAARDAAGVLREHFRRGVSMRSKEIANFVTDADLEAERAIVAAIRKHRPDHEILAEESHRGDSDAEHVWVVDLLDATHNFAHRVPHFSTSIAYYRNGKAEVGLVVNPLTDEWYRAERGKGAFLNGMPVRVNDHDRLDQTMLACGFPYDRGALMEATLKSMGDLIRSEIHGIRRMGCASLDLCWVGLGRFAGFFEYLLSPWDYAAGRLFVEEAGGVVTDCRGGPLGLDKSPVLAANGKIHAAMREIVARNHPA